MKNIRIGHGYDAHRFADGRRLVLGGVSIECTKGLLGHSDADVLTHAIMDALLGAMALGDIGNHFPDTDEAYDGASSIELLSRVYDIMCKEGYALINLDSTLVMQSPKISSYIPEMKNNIAVALRADMSCISVKATTEEGLGFTGSGDGASAHAVVLIENK